MKRILIGFILVLGSAVAHGAEAERLQLAREVIEASQASKMLDSMTGQLQQMVAAQLKGGGNLTPEKLAKVQAAQEEVIAFTMASSKAMLAKLDQIYADVYTEEELQAMKTFFLSKGGRAMIVKQPALMQRMMPLITEMQQSMMPKVQEIMKRHMDEAPAGGSR
jgi:hypothetical protein